MAVQGKNGRRWSESCRFCYNGAVQRFHSSGTATRMVAKQPADSRPMCSERDVKLIDPIWIAGQVPAQFWEDRHNRRSYLLWLGWRLRFRKIQDWYRLHYLDLRKNRGSRVLAFYRSIVSPTFCRQMQQPRETLPGRG